MRIIVANRIWVEKPSVELMDWCKKNLVIANPEYVKKERMGFWVGGTPKTLSIMEWNAGKLVLPYGCLSFLLDNFVTIFDVVEYKFTEHDVVNYGGRVPLYDYQRAAVDEMKKHNCGILQSPAGSGKTQMGIALAAELKLKTLWLTHTVDLLKQSQKRAEQYISGSLIGTITAGKVNIGKGITFATVQTMRKLDLDLYRDEWDCIIVDECHRAAGTPIAMTMFSRVLNALAAPYKFGLSATVHRADGMIAATYSLLGKIIYAVPEEEVKDAVLKVGILVSRTGIGLDRAFLDTDGTIDHTKMIGWLCEHTERNRKILCDINGCRGNSCLILSHRLSHLEYLMSKLPADMREDAVMISGKMATKAEKAAREQALEDMREGRKKYLFATYSLAKEGLDIPRLDRLFLTTPQKDYAVVTQSIGRIARRFKGKDEPIAYDYVDDGIPQLVHAFKRRRSTYNKLGCEYV